jgi:hypothetical protein
MAIDSDIGMKTRVIALVSVDRKCKSTMLMSFCQVIAYPGNTPTLAPIVFK